MKQLIVILNFLILLMISKVASAQNNDTTLFESCRDLYEKEMLKEALYCYKQYDTSSFALYKTALIAKKLGDRKTYKKSSKRLVRGKIVTAQSISYYSELLEGDSLKQLKAINKGLKRFPNDTILLSSKLNYFLKHKSFRNANIVSDQLIEYTKGNIKTLYFTKGYICQSLNNIEQSLDAYNKAIDIDSLYFNPYYNISVIYFNFAFKLYEEANNALDNDEYQIKIKLANDDFKKSLPYLIKAHEIRPKDLTLLECLRTVYYHLKMNQEYNEIKEKIEELKM